MKKVKKITLIFITVVVLTTAGCNILDFIRSLGFYVHTTISVFQNGRTRVVDAPQVNMTAGWIRDFRGAAGTTTFVQDFTTDDRGRYAIGGGRAPALWQFGIVGDRLGFCHSAIVNGFTAPLGTTEVRCPGTIGIFFTSAPDSIDVQAPPATLTINGQGIDATCGMPTLDFYDENGTIVAQTTATEVAGDGTWVSAATPYMDASSYYGGTYTIGVNNAMPDGTSNPVGYAAVWLYNSNPPPPPPPPDPCLNQAPSGSPDQPMTQRPACDYNNY